MIIRETSSKSIREFSQKQIKNYPMPPCQVCSDKEAKYKCPACSIQTCSLDCVRKHKSDQRCPGKRPRSDHIRISEFDDGTLHRGTKSIIFVFIIPRIDFNFLDESNTLLYRCRSTARPDHLRKRDKLKSECYHRGIHLKLMPHVFSLAESNSTTIRNRKDEEGNASVEIMWKVDWNFESKGVVLTDTCVSETKALNELLQRFIDNTWKLGSTENVFSSPNASVDHLEVFLVNYQKAEIKVDSTLSLRDAMRDQAILEYPTFIIRENLVVSPS